MATVHRMKCRLAPPFCLNVKQPDSTATEAKGGTSLYFRDPDDNSVEVAPPGLWPHY